MTTPILVRSIMHGVVITILLCCRSHWHLLSQPVDCLSLSSWWSKCHLLVFAFYAGWVVKSFKTMTADTCDAHSMATGSISWEMHCFLLSLQQTKTTMLVSVFWLVVTYSLSCCWSIYHPIQWLILFMLVDWFRVSWSWWLMCCQLCWHLHSWKE